MTQPQWPADDLVRQLGDREQDDLEFKRDGKDRDLLRKAICALANDLNDRGRGVLLIGVDKGGEPTGVSTSDSELLKIAEFRNEGRILPLPVIRISRGMFKSVEVIRVDVVPASSPPVQFDGRIWVRVGPSTRHADREEERVLSERRRFRDVPYDSRPVEGSSIGDLDQELFRTTYLPAAVDAEVLAENERSVAHQLASLRLATSEGIPLVAGILVLGLDPTDWISGAYVQFVRYAGLDVAAPVADERELRSNMIQMIGQMETILRGHNRVAVAEGNDWSMRSMPEYPERSLRELVLNALVHRNYETSNAPIRFQWFDDRIEITNPGGPFGVVRADNFRERNDYRNPDLAAAVKTLGYVNRFGRGITLVEHELAGNGNPPPEFSVEPMYWSVTVKRRT